jgi:pyruvate,orthophosphate dikinase
VRTGIGGYTHAFDAPSDLTPDEARRLLGGKGANLAEMARDLGLPVPPGFTISTRACLSYLAGASLDGLDAELRTQMVAVGERLGRRFGDPEDPLVVSVRSGAPVSMPGMMDTILDLGLNDATAAGLAAQTGDEAFAANCLARFRDGYRVVIGVDMVPDDPWEQLRAAIEAVFRSWNGERARVYRRREGIPDDLGTAVTVQAMVFGNRGPDSATGVAFTRNPATGDPVLYGDVLFDAQGEDVVAGGRATRPLAELDVRMPGVGAQLRQHADTLERHYRDLCDIEFTVEQGSLWLLQVRTGKRSPQAALRIALAMAEEAGFPVSRKEAVQRTMHMLADPPRVFLRHPDAPAPIAVGLPASPGVATGALATSSDAAENAAAGGRRVILARPETSPDDVRGMSVSAGVLTARGGLASHAAVVARGWGIPAVVGVESLAIDGDSVSVGGRRLRAGDEITIDGSTGEVFVGELPGRWEVVPEAATLQAWAAELGIEVEAAADGPEAPSAAGPTAEVTADDVLRSLAIKGSSTVAQLADALGGPPDLVGRLADDLVGRGLAEARDGACRLTAGGKRAAQALLDADRSVLGKDRCGDLLEAFRDLDRRMKEIVTAWQLREVGGQRVLNDHSDEAWDQRALDDLAALQADTAAWLGSFTTVLARFERYRDRLRRALQLAVGGDYRYVASPRVDSFHGVWFELHEDLLRLAGRQREA